MRTPLPEPERDRATVAVPVVGAILVALLFAGCLVPPPPLLPDTVVRTSDLIYGAGYVYALDGSSTYALAPLHYDLIELLGETGADRPAVVMIHGGGFTTGTRKDEDLVRFAGQVADAGYVCYLIDYRLLGDMPPPVPADKTLEDAARAAFVDAKVALRHVRATADVYGVDPNRVAVMGESAGAFAALAAGVSDRNDFANDGPGFPVPPENNPGPTQQPAALIDFWGSANPVIDEFDPNDPPILVVHGTEDPLPETPFTEAERIRDAAVAKGIPVVFRPLPSEGHGPWDATSNGQTLAEIAVGFLNEFL